MSYRVLKDEVHIESADSIGVGEGGVLITYEDRTQGYIENKRIITVYAPGQWDVAFWDED